jgi:hypothetical protein
VCFAYFFFQRERAVPNPLRARSPGSQLELAKCHVQGFFLFLQYTVFFVCARRSGISAGAGENSCPKEEEVEEEERSAKGGVGGGGGIHVQ